jgi:hypothetical protein
VHDVAHQITSWLAATYPEVSFDRDAEQLLVDRLVGVSGQEPWQVFLDLDDQLGKLAESADSRLAFQNTYPISS